MSGENAFAKTFSIEYTSLIVIILSFVVAAFNQVPEPKIVSAPHKLTTQQSMHSIGIYHLNNLFQNGSNNMSIEAAGQLNALIQVIKSHDVYVHAKLYNAYEETEDRDLALGLALERAQMLRLYFKSIGIGDSLMRTSVIDNNKIEGELGLSEFEFYRLEGS